VAGIDICRMSENKKAGFVHAIPIVGYVLDMQATEETETG
jgi:hypothetical protein